MEKLAKESALLDPLVNRVEAKIEAAGKAFTAKVEQAAVKIEAKAETLYVAGLATGVTPGLLIGLLIAALFRRK